MCFHLQLADGKKVVELESQNCTLERAGATFDNYYHKNCAAKMVLKNVPLGYRQTKLRLSFGAFDQ